MQKMAELNDHIVDQYLCNIVDMKLQIIAQILAQV